MNTFLDKLLKVRSGFLRYMRLLLIMDLITFFSIFYAVFIIFNVKYFLNKSSLYLPVPIEIIPPILAFIIAIIGSLLLHRKDSKVNVTLLIEDKYPELKEKLRTAYDNRNETNIIVRSLISHVSDALNKVSSSQLLAKNKIAAKVLVTFIFIAGAATIALNPDTYSISTDIWNNISNTISTGIGNATGQIEVTGRPENSDKVGTNGTGDVIGKPMIASIAGKNIDLTLYSDIGPGFVIKNVSQMPDQFIRSTAFPVDVVGSSVSDGGYNALRRKTEVERQLINKYAIERSKI